MVDDLDEGVIEARARLSKERSEFAERFAQDVFPPRVVFEQAAGHHG